jgi:hypothetical protein
MAIDQRSQLEDDHPGEENAHAAAITKNLAPGPALARQAQYTGHRLATTRVLAEGGQHR